MKTYRIKEELRNARIVHAVQRRKMFRWKDIPRLVFGSRFRAIEVAYRLQLKAEGRS